MGKAPYTTNPANIKKFFTTIQGVGIPPKVDNAYLRTIGFGSSNDRYLVVLSKSLGFTDAKGKPTAVWNDFRDKTKAQKVMGDAIKVAYADLYGTYPDAEKRDPDTLQNYFASAAGVAVRTAQLMMKTFKNLCEFADFKVVAVTEPTPTPSVPTPEHVAEVTTGVKPVTININIQLQLPATEDATIYDTLFGALKKHLFS